MTENALHKSETSILFQPITLAVLFLCLLASIWFQLFTVIGILSFVLVLAGFIFVWNKVALKHVDVSLTLPISRVFTGDVFRVQTVVKNNKWIPLVWLDLAFQESELVTWRQKPFYIVRFMWLLSYKDIEFEVKGEARSRGVYEVGKISAKSGDGFRFMESEKKYDVHENLYIYPKLIPVQVPPFHSAMQWEVQGKQGGLLEDPLMISGVREYEQGDDLKRFNWWASARTGEMQTNIYERIVAKQLMIFVDVNGFIGSKQFEEEDEQRKYEEKIKNNFEMYLSVIASFAVTYDERGIQVGFSTNALNYINEPHDMVRPANDMTEVLDSMAQMTRRVHCSINELVTSSRSALPMYIFCETITEQHLLLYEEERQKRHIQFYYRTENEASKRLADIASTMDDLRFGGEKR